MKRAVEKLRSPFLTGKTLRAVETIDRVMSVGHHVRHMSVARTKCPDCGFEVHDVEECVLCGADLQDTASED